MTPPRVENPSIDLSEPSKGAPRSLPTCIYEPETLRIRPDNTQNSKIPTFMQYPG